MNDDHTSCYTVLHAWDPVEVCRDQGCCSSLSLVLHGVKPEFWYRRTCTQVIRLADDLDLCTFAVPLFVAYTLQGESRKSEGVLLRRGCYSKASRVIYFGNVGHSEQDDQDSTSTWWRRGSTMLLAPLTHQAHRHPSRWELTCSVKMIMSNEKPQFSMGRDRIRYL